MKLKSLMLNLDAQILSSERQGSVIVAKVKTSLGGQATIEVSVQELEQLQQSSQKAGTLRPVS